MEVGVDVSGGHKKVTDPSVVCATCVLYCVTIKKLLLLKVVFKTARNKECHRCYLVCCPNRNTSVIGSTCCICVADSCLSAQQEIQHAPPPPKTKVQQPPQSFLPYKETQTASNLPSSPSVALLRLLQTAFNRQSPALQQPPPPRASSTWRNQQPRLQAPATRLPPQTLYQALDMINKYGGPEDNVYSDYADGFYRTKPYRHRDDRLLQALFQMIGDEEK